MRTGADDGRHQGRHAETLRGDGDREDYQVAQEGGRPDPGRRYPRRDRDRQGRRRDGGVRCRGAPQGPRARRRESARRDADRRHRRAGRRHRGGARVCTGTGGGRGRGGGERFRSEQHSLSALRRPDPQRGTSPRAAPATGRGVDTGPRSARRQRSGRWHPGPNRSDGGGDRAREGVTIGQEDRGAGGCGSAADPGHRPGGRIIRRDVDAAAVTVTAVPAAAPTGPAVEYEDRPLSQIRATIAKRLPLSKAPVPHFYVTSEVAMDRAWELREELNALEGQPKASVHDLVVRASALALLRHPGVNASFQGESIRVWHRAHIGIAVALDDGLITPVLRDCQAKSLAQIAVEARDLVERARVRKLRVTELSGATFSISNLGMYDVVEFSAIINPPEGAILAVGSVRRVPVVDDGGLGVGRRMALTLSCDHRAMDGAMGARFLQDVKRLLEEPLRLLV